MTPLSFGGAPGVAVLGELSQLRRRGSRWRLRDWRLRTKLTAVLLVPLLLAGVLGTLRVADAVREARQFDALGSQVGFAQQVGSTVHDLQRERQLAVTSLGGDGNANDAEFQTQVKRVDLGVSGLRLPSSGATELAPDAADAYRGALARLDELAAVRQAVVASGTSADDALARYTEAITALLNLNRVVLAGANDPLDRQAGGIADLTLAKEQLSHQHSLLLAALATGQLSPEQQTSLRTADARLDVAVDEFREAVPAEQRELYARTVSGDAVAQSQRLLDDALGQGLQGGRIAVDPVAWNNAAGETTERVRQVERTLLDQLGTRIGVLSDDAWNAAVRDAAVVALVLLLAVVLLVIVVRSLLRPLRVLRTAAFDVADQRLPDAVESLRITDGTVDERVVDPVPVYSRDEVGQVARAFDTVHLQAVRLAAEQAILRNTVNDIFLNLAGRSQRLVERQLKLIDELENAEQDPEQLSSLFQLDHLATRMRRNSENLLVLAGGRLRSVSEHGIAVLDMLRAAVSEIEEYRRVTLRRPPAATVAGPVVNDLVHLIAELLDNATVSTPPDAPVTLSSALTEEGGLLVEITDCGTGLSPTELHEINERLASPPMVDVAVSQHMGLFVVSRLAARHGIRVRLRQQQRDFGITASVLLPAELVATDQTPTDQVLAPPLASTRTPPPMPTIRSARDDRDSERDTGHDRDPEAAEYPEDAEQAGSSGTTTHGPLPPMRVSVVEDQNNDLFTPSSIGRIPQPEPEPEPRPEPRTQRSAVEEWAELFGSQEAEEGPAREAARAEPPTAHPSAAGARTTPPLPRRIPRNRDAPAEPPQPRTESPRPRVGGSSARARSAQPEEPQVREQIYEMVSAWFQEQKSGAARQDEPSGPDAVQTPPSGIPRVGEPAPHATVSAGATAGGRGTPDASAWHSAADDGWQAAEALGSRTDYDVTASGLPRRRPRAHLVPGTAGAEPSQAASGQAAGHSRSPDDVRGRLSSYQQGLRHGRHARRNPDDQWAAVPQQGTFEEDQS